MDENPYQPPQTDCQPHRMVEYVKRRKTSVLTVLIAAVLAGIAVALMLPRIN